MEETLEIIEPTPIEEPKIPTVDGFLSAYKKLCQEMGYELAITPNWKKSADLGTYSLEMVISVRKKEP